ncbi:hypothetical protein RB595_006112 [Gaeumannomyces hyphopodioides]
MSASASAEAVTRSLLARAHSPSAVDRIYSEKIQHRPLRLRANSPTPAANAREARRRARRQQDRDRRRAVKPAPLSARERRRLRLHDAPQGGAGAGRRYATFEPLRALWLGYAREVLGDADLRLGGPAAAAKLTSADFHGAEVEVVRSSCPGRVGIRGIVVKDAKYVFEVVTRKNTLKVVPKEGTVFRVEIPVTSDGPGSGAAEAKAGTEVDDRKFVFEIHGDQFKLRSADRANKKFKAHYLPNL